MLAVAFPHDQVQILPYNRTVKDLGGLTAKAFLDAIAKSGFDFGGVKLNYAATKNQGMDEVFFTILQADGSFRPVTRLLKTSVDSMRVQSR